MFMQQQAQKNKHTAKKCAQKLPRQNGGLVQGSTMRVIEFKNQSSDEIANIIRDTKSQSIIVFSPLLSEKNNRTARLCMMHWIH